MSTRSCIARRKGDGFEGVYHHWDGYPTSLGATLWRLHHGNFNSDVKDMLAFLIDEHPAGWSTINGCDFSKAAGYAERTMENLDDPHGPICYCHGERHEEGQLITHEDDAGMEWAYVFDEDNGFMSVLERCREDGSRAIGMFGTLGKNPETRERDDHWVIRHVAPLDGEEPNWQDAECGPNLERCHHYKWAHDDTVCRGCDGDGWRDSGGHRHEPGVYTAYPCGSDCVPQTQAPGTLRGDDPNWHVTRPRTCEDCEGTGKVGGKAESWVTLAVYVASNGDDAWEVRRGKDGVMYCTCPSWRFSGEKKPCLHMTRFIAQRNAT